MTFEEWWESQNRRKMMKEFMSNPIQVLHQKCRESWEAAIQNIRNEKTNAENLDPK